MSNHCLNLVAIGLKERLIHYIRCRYPGGYRFARPDRKKKSVDKEAAEEIRKIKKKSKMNAKRFTMLVKES